MKQSWMVTARKSNGEHQILSATLLYLSNERTDIQSMVRHLCTKLRTPTALEMRQLKRLLRYAKVRKTWRQCSRCNATASRERERETVVKKLEVFTDSDWASVEEEYEWSGDHGRGHEVECSQSWSSYSGFERLGSRGGRSVAGHQGGVIVAGGVDVCRLGALRD